VPTQQPKAAIAAIEDLLLKVYAKAWQDIMDLQEQIAADPLKWRRRRRLNELLKAVEDKMADLDVRTRAWATSELVRPYALGAAAGAVELGESAAAVWTQLPEQAISRIATDTLDDLLKSTRYVRRTTKALIRAIGKDEILAKLTRGDTAVQAGRRMAQILADKGIHAIRYKDGSMHGLKEYAEMLVRTKTAEAYNLGVLESQEVLGVEFWEIFDGAGCGLTSHQDPVKALGRIVDKATAEKYPISHPNAIMEGSQVLSVGGIRAAYRAEWSGPVYVVRTAAGSRLTVGPNHPVLTVRGWLPARSLREGDQVLRSTVHRQIPVLSADVHLDEVPASVSDVFATLRHLGAHSRVVPASDDLHGDGEFCQGEVDVVAVAEAFLPYEEQARSGEGFSHQLFVPTAVRERAFRGLSTAPFRLLGVSLPAPSTMRSIDGDPVAGSWSNFDSALSEALAYDAARAADTTSQILGRSASEIELDQIIEIRYVESWTGHAYDLETGTGVYWCDGILVHNCRRAYGARPDIHTKLGAEAASPSVTKDQVADNLAADQARSRAQQARRYRMRARHAPRPAQRQAKATTITAARRGDVNVPTKRRKRR